MPTHSCNPEQQVTLLLVILGVSVVLQVVAAWIALLQINIVFGRYRLAWVCIAIALGLMVERRLAPLWRQIDLGEAFNAVDAVFGLAISVLMAAGMYGLKAVFSDLRLQANTDPLTGLTNRRAVIPQAQHEIDRAMRAQHPVAFLMFDIDRFKRVNDNYGHPAGDVVLRAVADIARATFRHIDCVARIGGEEFLAVLPESDQASAVAAAERFRSAIAAKEFTFGDKQMSITMSIGVVLPDITGQAVNVKEVMQAADTALYAAKNSGRNRVVVMGVPGRPQ